MTLKTQFLAEIHHVGIGQQRPLCLRTQRKKRRKTRRKRRRIGSGPARPCQQTEPYCEV